jgi:hypothetical protein
MVDVQTRPGYRPADLADESFRNWPTLVANGEVSRSQADKNAV